MRLGARKGTFDYPVKLIINVTKIAASLTLRFDACQILPYKNLKCCKIRPCNQACPYG